MKKRSNILVLHGPNLNLLGERSPKIYGRLPLPGINRLIRAEAARLGLTVKIFQRNGEGELLDLLHKNRGWADGILINAGAYTHYSYALRDALEAIALPTIEVHLSDISKREPWRKVSVIHDVCISRSMGKGPKSYLEALRRLARKP